MGRKKFSQREINVIGKLLARKMAGTRFQQKMVRHTLRTTFEFNIADFNVQGKAFGPEDLQNCIRRGAIQILDDATIESMKLRHAEKRQRDEELRLYLGLVLASIAAISWNVRGLYDTLEETIRHAAFQVSSIITTTGYATTDFDLWPSFSKGILLLLMVVGACAGSTGGGIKCIRVILLLKSLRRNIRQVIHPRKVEVVRNNGQVIDEKILANTNAYLAAYVVIIIVSFLVISLDNFSTATNFTAVLACFNNIGPGLEAVGPTCNFSAYSDLSKLVLSFDMLAGRLEIFPILALFTRGTWRVR